MEVPMALVIGVLFAAGTYSILRPNLIRIVLGFSLYSNAVNLTMIAAGGYSLASDAPFVGPNTGTTAPLMDPLPPDIILTAIVISFAVSALFLTICYRVYQDLGTDDPEQLPQFVEEDSPQTSTSPDPEAMLVEARHDVEGGGPSPDLQDGSSNPALASNA